MFDEFKEIIQSWLNWFRKLPVLVKAFFWLVILVSLCSYCCDFYARILAVGVLETELPQDAKGVRSMYWWGMQGSDTAQISFRVTPENLDEFIRRSCIDPLIERYNPFLPPYDLAKFQEAPTPQSPEESGFLDIENERRFISALVFGKWRPKKLSIAYAGIEGYCDTEGTYPKHHYWMVVDKSDPDLYQVYLEIVVFDK